MLDQLIQLVKQNAGDAIIKNPAIPDQQNDAAIKEVASDIMSSLQNQAKQGNLQDIMSMFQNAGSSSSLTSNPLVAQIINNVSRNLGSKFGVSPQVAQQIATSLLPTVLNQFVKKTNDPNDKDFDLQDMLGKFTGNSNIGDMVGKLGGSKGTDAGGVLGKIFG